MQKKEKKTLHMRTLHTKLGNEDPFYITMLYDYMHILLKTNTYLLKPFHKYYVKFSACTKNAVVNTRVPQDNGTCEEEGFMRFK